MVARRTPRHGRRRWSFRSVACRRPCPSCRRPSPSAVVAVVRGGGRFGHGVGGGSCRPSCRVAVVVRCPFPWRWFGRFGVSRRAGCLSICPGVCLTRSGRSPLPRFAVVRSQGPLSLSPPWRNLCAPVASVGSLSTTARPIESSPDTAGGVVPSIIPTGSPLFTGSGRGVHASRGVYYALSPPAPMAAGLTRSHVGLAGVLLDTLPRCLCRPFARPPSRRSVSPRRGSYGRSCVVLRSYHRKR